MTSRNDSVAGFDVGGAHLKVTRVEDGRIVAASMVAMPLWQGLDRLERAFAEISALHEGCRMHAFTMTGELSDVFASRDEGVVTLVERIRDRFADAEICLYAGRSGFVAASEALALAGDIASANWHATATLVSKLLPEALFVDMGSTTTDIVAVSNGVRHEGYTDAERLLCGELVYTGFTRTFLFGVASSAPVDGRITPLMNEYFASMADAHRVLGVLDEEDDRHPSADGREKTQAASIARLARVLGRDAGDLSARGWRDVARWFSERQLRTVHDAAVRVAGRVAEDAPLVGAGTGRWQIRRLADRMERPFVDLADLLPAGVDVRHAASRAGPASAVALLAAGLRAA